MKRFISTVAILALLSSGVTYAATNAEKGVSTGQQQQEQINRQKTMQKQLQKGKNKQTFQSQGYEKSITIQKSQTSRQNFTFSFQKTVNLTTIFYPAVRQLERMNVYPFSQCKIISDPPTPKRLGISYTEDGVVDLIKKQYLESLAEEGANYNCPKCTFYARCGVLYGAILQQAAQNMLNDLSHFNLVSKTINGFKVSKLTIGDLQDLAVAEIIKTVKSRAFDIPYGWRHAKVRLTKNISGYIVYTTDGHAVEVTTVPFSVLYNGVVWLSTNEFGGIIANMVANAGMSTEQALSTLQANKKYSNKAKQIVDYLNTLKLKGYTIQLLQAELSQGNVNLNARANFFANER